MKTVVTANDKKLTNISKFCFYNYIYDYRVSWVGYDAMWSNMCLMQIIDEFCGQSQGSSGKIVAITWSGQRTGLIGWITPHLLLLTLNSPSFISEYKQPNHALEGSRASGRWLRVISIFGIQASLILRKLLVASDV